MSSGERHCYEFGPFRLDPEARTLLREGRQVSLTPKAFDVLVQLIQGGGRVVKRDELLSRVWPDSFVEEGNLKVTIFMLRKALDENPAAPQYVETVPRHGYRFAAEVAKTSARERVATSSERGAANSIAVLPFKLLTGGEDYLGLGLTDALIVRLSKLRQIVVRPTSSVRSYASSAHDPIAAGRELRVNAVLEGNIHRAGDRVRVTAQLIDVETEAPLWAEKFDARFTDILDLEDSISEQVADALTPELTGEDRARLARRYTENSEAYRLNLMGRYFWSKRTSEGMKRAADLFRTAIDLDPAYAPAYTGLADCYAQLGWMRLLSPAEAFPRAKAAAAKALELDQTLAEAHTSLAWGRLLYDWDWAQAEAGFKRAAELNPNYAVAPLWYSVQLMATGRFEESIVASARALELDPLSPVPNAVAGWPFYFLRRYEEAIARYHRSIEAEPRALPARILLGCAYAQTGAGEKAVEQLETARALDGSPLVLSELGSAYAVAGRESDARNLLSELNHMSRDRYVSPYDVAGIHLRLGENEQALALLHEAAEDHSCWFIFIGVEPRLDPLRGDPRFGDLLERIALPQKS